MRIINSLIFSFFLAGNGVSCANSQTAKPQPRPAGVKKHQQPSVEINTLVSDARSAPAEFSADALIRIVESNSEIRQAQKRKLLEEAFRRAAEAQHKVRQQYIGGAVDTRSGYLARAFDLKLDTLSLQSRAVLAMLEIDKQTARALLSDIPPKLPLATHSCKDTLVYDVGDFYRTLQQVAKEAFSPEEKQQDEHIFFVQRYIDEISSPVQVAPAARMILALSPNYSQLATLNYAFIRALKRIAGDDRAFSFSMVRGREGLSSLSDLLRAIPEQSAELKRDLSQAVRAYLVANLRDGRCADNVKEKAFVESANKAVGFEKPISADEVRPEKLLESPESHEYWQTPEARKLLAGAKRLRFGSGNKPLSLSEKEDPDWQVQLSEFSDNLADWDMEREKSEADFFHQKSVLLGSLLELVPEGPSRDKALKDYVLFLRDSPMQRENKMEWLLHVNDLLRRSRTFSGDYASKVLTMLVESENSNLRLYANLAKIEPPSRSNQKPKS